MPQTGAPAWTITGQVERTQYGPDNKLQTGVVVTFSTAKGNVGTVFVPDTQLTPDTVSRMVSARAATLDAITNLQGG